MEKKTREYYLSLLQVGNIIAFRIDDLMFSGKVIEMGIDIHKVQTKNGSIYLVRNNEIAWVKNGSHWPIGIYNALKYSKNAAKLGG